MNYLLKPIKQYATFEGRARRREFWTFIIVTSIISLMFTTLNLFISLGWVGTIFTLFILVPTLAVTTRRLHDIGKSGKWIFAFIGVGIVVNIIIFTMMGAYIASATPDFFESFMNSDPEAIKQATKDLQFKAFPWTMAAFVLSKIFPFVMLLKEGDKGENEYGLDPKEEELENSTL